MRIAVIRLSSFGDVLCTGPAVRGLRAAYPEARIAFITTHPYVDLAAGLPGLDEVIGIERRGEAFEQDLRRVGREQVWHAVADLQGSSRSGRLARAMGARRRVTDRPPRLRRALLIAAKRAVGSFPPVPLRMLRALAPWGVRDDGEGLRLDVDPAAADNVERRWGDLLDGAIAFAPGARHATKRWPPDHWAALLGAIEPARRVVILGGPGETPMALAEAVQDKRYAHDLTGLTTPMESAALLARARLLVCGDTGPMHLALAVGTPVVALFGPTVREFGFFPFRSPDSVVLERNLWCRPCSAHGGARCPLGHHRCLRTITPLDAFSALGEVERNLARKERSDRAEQS